MSEIRTLRIQEILWRVYESGPSHRAPQTRSLIFESDGVTRRIRAYPPNWSDIEDSALTALFDGRAVL